MKKEDKEAKKRVLDFANKVNSGEYEHSEDYSRLKNKREIKKGKKSKSAGGRFELKVRKDLEDKGWIIDKWTNNIDLEEEKIIPAKRKFNPFSKVLTIGTGFPDFIVIKNIGNGTYDIMGIEVKMNGLLSKEEKDKCRFYLKNGTFSKILIAKSILQGRKLNIEYIDFKEKYER